MNYVDNIYRLAAILNAAGGEVLGMTKFQQLVYLAQAKGLGLEYDFRPDKYGVFCPELKNDLESARLSNLIWYEETGDYGNPSIIEPNIDVDDIAAARLEQGDNPKALAMITALKDEPVNALEVLAIIVYFANKGDGGAECNKQLLQLDKDLAKYLGRAKELYKVHFQSA